MKERIIYVTYKDGKIIKTKDPHDSRLPPTIKMMLVTSGSRSLFVRESLLESFLLAHGDWRTWEQWDRGHSTAAFDS